MSSKRRLHPTLLIHPAPIAGSRRLIAQTDAGRRPLIIRSPLALSALSMLPGEFDRQDAFDAWQAGGISEDHQEQLWSAFDGAGLLVESNSSPGGSWWQDLGWREAAAYHLGTRDYPFVQMDRPGAFAIDGQRMDGYGEQASAPSPYTSVDASAHVELDRLGAEESADERMAGMSTGQRLGREGLGLLLDVCFGERGQFVAVGGARSLLKSIPSGGARHPTEVHVACFSMGGVPDGIYHYSVEHHRLDLIREGNQAAALTDATYDLFTKHDAPPSAMLVFSSLVERAMWRYRDPRSFRAIALDVGHAVAAYRYAARLIGFRTYALQKLRDRELGELLAIDPLSQPPLYAATLVPPSP